MRTGRSIGFGWFMIKFEKHTDEIIEYFGSKGADLKSAIVLVKSDLGRDMVSKDVWVLLTEKELAIVEGAVVVKRSADSKKPVKSFEQSYYVSYPIEDVEKLESEEMISSGLVSLVIEGESVLGFNYSKTFSHEVHILKSAFNELKKEGKVDEKKLKLDAGEEPYCPHCGRRYADQKRKICSFCVDRKHLVTKLMGFFVKYKGYIAMIMLTFLMITAIGLVTPYISNKVFYDEVLNEDGKYYGKIIQMVLVIVGVRVFRLLIDIINGIISAWVCTRVTYDLKKTIYDAINRLSLGFFSSRQTGGLMTQINSDATTIYWFFCDGFPYLVTNAIQLVGVAVIMFMTNASLALYTFITIPLFFICYHSFHVLFKKLHARAYARRRSLNSLISDVLSGIRVVKSFAREDREVKRFDDRSQAAADADTIISVTSSKTFPVLAFLLQLGTYVVWAVGGRQVMLAEGNMSYGDLAAFMAYISMVYSPIDFFANISETWTNCLNALQRLFEISDTIPDITESENAVSPADIKGEVEFRNVHFSYEEGREIIKDVSFKVQAGKTLGIVGHTGAGKSTLANLLTRLYDPSKGSVYIDGIDLKQLSFASLRDSIAIVSQETYLFRGSIMDNIRYAVPSASNEEVIAAAKIASAHDFIIKYPDGYQTVVGLGHKELSGGERQRVSIARAVLKNPKILILDEATAAMDTQTERQIQAALNRLTKGRTTIIIAHRLSTLRDADNLIVIERGKVEESGTATELLKKKGIYYKLYKLQAEALRSVGLDSGAALGGGRGRGGSPSR